MSLVSYKIAVVLIFLLIGIFGLITGENIYRREQVYLLDPDTAWGKRTRLRGWPARLVGLLLMTIGAISLFLGIASIFLDPVLSQVLR
ncbi:MAG: hypothetical protein Q9O62_09475 [Ardenticatenia bacterium]|nr:hypothetical protein [Ardenticatenia bacterium]